MAGIGQEAVLHGVEPDLPLLLRSRPSRSEGKLPGLAISGLLVFKYSAPLISLIYIRFYNGDAIS